jgi:toxin-antitoxin system PIN domain toxin
MTGGDQKAVAATRPRSAGVAASVTTSVAPSPTPSPTPSQAQEGVSQALAPLVTAEPPTTLLDGNVLVALMVPSHIHHAAAEEWFSAFEGPFASCPITQGTLLRLLCQLGGYTLDQARQALGGLVHHPRHRFWPDAIGYGQILWTGVLGHRQVTDAYLAGLARHQAGRLATFDRGLAALHPDVAVILEA